jgi:hypothetical protein
MKDIEVRSEDVTVLHRGKKVRLYDIIEMTGEISAYFETVKNREDDGR